MAVEPIRWHGDRLELLDQRLLPDQTVYVTCRTAAEVAQAIRDMVVRGAPAIGCAAAFGVALSKGSPESYEVLAKSRPTAVNLFWALERMKKAKDLDAEAEAIFTEDLAANRAMGKLGAELIPRKARVMTHCNTGALATAGYGTALGRDPICEKQEDLGDRERDPPLSAGGAAHGVRADAGRDSLHAHHRQHGRASHEPAARST